MAESPFLFSLSTGINLKNPAPSIHSRPKLRSVVCICTQGSNFGNEGRVDSSKSKVPSAPWMKGPLLAAPSELLEFNKQRTAGKFVGGTNRESHDVDLTRKVGGGRNKSAMKKIVKEIQKLRQQQPHDLDEIDDAPEKFEFEFARRGLFLDGDRLYEAEVEKRDEGSEENWGIYEAEFPIREVVKEARSKILPWKKEETVMVGFINKEATLLKASELNLDGILLERLQREAPRLRKWVKVKKAGVTQAVVDEVHSTWKSNELALLKFDVPLCRNMGRAREIVELKTGGVAVWRNKDILAVYRGDKYESSVDFSTSGHKNFADTVAISESSLEGSGSEQGVSLRNDEWETLGMASLYEREGDRLLEGLGPRFIDWWMHKPLPVDADMLPESVPGFKVPFRLCPQFTTSKLTGAELADLRKHAHSLPTHFVLGRNRRLQGLAVAILKLWEKCHIAKIALKWGVPNTDNEQMANELKSLTGGVLLLRNKFLIVLYRGKDFVPPEVAKAVVEREMELSGYHLEEEAARLKASETSFLLTEECRLNRSSGLGTLSEFQDNIRTYRHNLAMKEADVQLESQRQRLEEELKEQQRKLSLLKKKIEKAARELDKLKESSRLSEPDPDPEIISNEERETLRKIGLMNDNTLVLGRRGVYDGVIEGMHQHWKHREVVKVITMQKKYSDVMFTAKTLEAESRGIIVSIVKLKEGYAIMVYRGKNYKRPKSPAGNLLSKREALSKSLALQRLGSLKFFAKRSELAILDLKLELGKLSVPPRLL